MRAGRLRLSCEYKRNEVVNRGTGAGRAQERGSGIHGDITGRTNKLYGQNLVENLVIPTGHLAIHLAAICCSIVA